MKILSLILILVYITEAKDIIRFAPLPMESASKTLEIFTPFVKYLEKKSGKKIKYVYRSTNIDVMNGLKSGEIDIAYFGPLPYAKIKQEFKDTIPIAQYLEKNGKKTYTCTVFKRKGDKISLNNMKNTKIALTHKYSTCGYAFVYDVLSEHNSNIDNNNFKYIGSHYEAIAEVLTGDFEIGGVKTSIFNKHKHLDIESIAISKPNPGLMIVANGSTLSKKEIKEIKNIILSITKDDKKSWNSKIKKDAIDPDIKLLEDYAKRIKNIKLKDDK